MSNRNLELKICALILILVILTALFMYRYESCSKLAEFIILTMTAIGTCGVTILTIYPYEHRDILSCELYRNKHNNCIFLKVSNKTNHTIYLGSDGNSQNQHPDNFLLIWPDSDPKENPDNAVPIWSQNGDNLIVPPHDTIFFPMNEHLAQILFNTEHDNWREYLLQKYSAELSQLDEQSSELFLQHKHNLELNQIRNKITEHTDYDAKIRRMVIKVRTSRGYKANVKNTI